MTLFQCFRHAMSEITHVLDKESFSVVNDLGVLGIVKFTHHLH